MMRKYLFTFSILFAAASINCFSQKTWTLEECVNYALEHNIQIKQQALQTEVDNNNYNQSKFELLPDLGAGFDHQFNSGRALNQETYKWETNSFQQGSIGAQSQITLFNGLRNINNINYQKLNLMASTAKLQKAKNDLALNIAATYLQALYSKEILNVAKSQLDVTQLQVNKYKSLVEVGNVAKGSLLEIQAQAAAEKVNVTNAQNNLDISLLTLAQMLDLDTLKNFNIAEPQELSVSELIMPDSIEAIYNDALGLMPEVKASEFQMKGAQKYLAIEKGSRYPTLSASASFYSRYNELAVDPLNPTKSYSYSTQLKDNQYKQIGLNLSIPIFTRWSVQTRINNAKINYLNAQLSYDLTKQILYKEIGQARADAIASFQNFQSNSEAVTASEESFKYVQQKFDVGMVNSVDYNVAKNTYAKAKSDLIQAKYRFVFKTKVLDFYRGKTIKL